MGYICLTTDAGNEIYVNVDFIVHFAKLDGEEYTRLKLACYDDEALVEETPEEIMQLINESAFYE